MSTTSTPEYPPQPAVRIAEPSFPATNTLITINLVVYAAMGLSGVSLLETRIDQLLRWGADFGPLTLHGQWWRLLSSAFVHGGLLHIGFNMYCFWSIGRL